MNKMQKKLNKRRRISRNTHARAKRRIKVLKLKMFSRRVMDVRHKKIMAAHKTPGVTIVGKAKNYATYIPWLSNLRNLRYRRHRLMHRKNQKQKRRLWRQAPHMRLRA